MKKAAVTAAVASVLIVGTGLAVASNSSEPTAATETTPIQQQVEDHEQRIGTLETKTDDIQTQTTQNSSDIAAVQGSISGAPAPAVSQPEQPAPAPSAPAPEPEPAPAPVIDGRTVTSVTDVPGVGTRTCTYTLYDPVQSARQSVVIQPIEQACVAVGQVLPRY